MREILIIILIALIVSVVEIFGIPYQTTVNGSHTGLITAVETTGIIFKTTTVYVKTDAQSSQEDKYCLKDKSLIEKLKAYEYSKQSVTVYFNDYLLMGLKNCDNEQGGIIIGVTNDN